MWSVSRWKRDNLVDGGQPYNRPGSPAPPRSDETVRNAPHRRCPGRRSGVGVDEKDILGRISALVDEEHELRSSTQHTDEQRTRMSKLEADLDQCWDLLRQR